MRAEEGRPREARGEAPEFSVPWVFLNQPPLLATYFLINPAVFMTKKYNYTGPSRFEPFGKATAAK